MRRFVIIVCLLTTVDAQALGCAESQLVEVTEQSNRISVMDVGRFELQELGAEIEYLDGGQWRPLALAGTRIGVHFFATSAPTQLQLRVLTRKSAKAMLRTQCQYSDIQWQWRSQAQKLAEQTDYTVNAKPDASALRLLENDVPDPWGQAALATLRANFLYRQQRLIESEQAFDAAAQLWQSSGELERARWMRLASAELAYRRLDRNRVQSVLAQLAHQGSWDIDYFAARFQELQCKLTNFAAQSLDRQGCRVVLIQRYRDLGEFSDQANSLINYAHMLRNNGQRIDVAAFRAEFPKLPDETYFATYRGRMYLLEGLLQRDAGQLALAIAAFDNAIKAYVYSNEDSGVSIANVLVHVADVYAELGLYEQSYQAIIQMLKHLRPRDMPARVAAGLNQLSDVLASDGRLVQARRVLADALRMQEKIGTPIDIHSSRMDALQLDIANLESADSRQLDALRFEIERLSRSATNDVAKESLTLMRARLAVFAKDLPLAKQSLKVIDPKDAANRNLHSLITAELAIAEGSPQRARELLYLRLAQIAKEADAAPTAGLAYLTIRSAERLRHAWVALVDAQTNVAEIFDFALLSNPARFLTPPVQNTVAKKSSSSNANEGFLLKLTDDQNQSPRLTGGAPMRLAALQNQAVDNTQVLILLPGEKQSIALWLASEQTKLTLLPGKSDLEAELNGLLGSLSNPNSSRLAAESTSIKLSATLFKGISLPAPKRLWVVADELSAAIPFAVLRWPGSSQYLLEQTEVSYVTGLRADVEVPAVAPMPSFAFVAPSYSEQVGQVLDFADVERVQIARALRVRPVLVQGEQATRAAIQQLLLKPGQWMHVSAHGKANPGVLGDAGLWLSGSEREDFLSWLDLSTQRTRAQLLVLNACQSGAGAVPSRQANLSFALAMSMSGAEHVIASLWPVSDVAAGTWIPAFYQSLVALDASQSGSALRTAQLKLMRSPHYRHPFFWGSLVHFRKL